MAPFTVVFLVLLKLSLITDVCAKEVSKSWVSWYKEGRHVTIGLATPDLPYWDQDNEVSTEYHGAFFFELSLSPDNLTLSLNGEPILPRARVYVPASLRAPQVGLAKVENIYRPVYLGTSPVMLLDYYMDGPDATAATSIYNTKYNPRIQIDILRASVQNLPDYSAPLSSDLQETIWIWLEDISEHPPGTPYTKIPLQIREVKVSKRWLNFDSEGTRTYRSLKSLRGCYLWSWLCADIDGYPYYEYIYQENFDEFGKKGSMRHFLTGRWASMVDLLGYWQAVIMLAVCGILMLSPSVYAICSGVKRVFDMYQMRMKEVDDWIADEEVDGFLESDRFLEDCGCDEKEQAIQDKRGEKANVEESLLLPPPYSEADGKRPLKKS